MPDQGLSMMSLAALGAYGLVVLACLAAAAAASARPGDRWRWLAGAVLFVGLGAFRLARGEDRLRGALRGAARMAGEYDQRWLVQTPLVVLSVLLAMWIGWRLLRHWQASPRGSRKRALVLAEGAMLALVPLYALRLISLHQVDAVLYAGPVRLNWLAEGALCAAVALAALLYLRRSRQRALHRARR